MFRLFLRIHSPQSIQEIMEGRQGGLQGSGRIVEGDQVKVWYVRYEQ